jgi:hypothetical protein
VSLPSVSICCRKFHFQTGIGNETRGQNTLHPACSSGLCRTSECDVAANRDRQVDYRYRTFAAPVECRFVILSDGRILIIGGDSGNGALESVEVFGTDGGVSAAAAINIPRSRHFAVVLNDGRVLLGGGVSSGGGTTNSAEIYDSSADTWTKTSAMAEARANPTAAVLQDGRVLIAVGDNSGNPSNTVEIFDPSNGSFTFAGTLSAARTKQAMATLQDGSVLIVGGSDGTNPLASSDIFDPSSGNISAGPSLGTARYSASATTLLNGQVAVIGGVENSIDVYGRVFQGQP